jgi:L-threonylcarbamoyladenylate synthase
MNQSLLQAARIIKSGGIVIYPTETLYALGCLGNNSQAVDRVFHAKNRDAAKPLPLLVGSWEQFMRFALADDAVTSIVRAFWPGPLSVLVTMKGAFPSRVMDGNKRTSIRWTPHPVAQQLCCLAEAPLVATSANPSGQPGPARLEDLDPGLRSRVDVVVQDQPFAGGGDPSTLIEVLAPSRVRIIRQGAIESLQFAKQGITVENPACSADLGHPGTP